MQKIIIMTCLSVLIFFAGCGQDIQSTRPPQARIEKYLPDNLNQNRHKPNTESAETNHRYQDNIDFSKPLNIEACLQIALSKNPSLQAATEAITTAKSSLGIVKSNYYPKLDAVMDYRRFQTHAFMPQGVGGVGGLPSSIVGPEHDYAAALTASVMLFDSGKRRSSLNSAKANLAASNQQADTVEQDIKFAVYESFYTVLSSKQILKVARQNLTRAKDHQRLAEERLNIGTAVTADVARSKVEVAKLKLDVVRAENILNIAKGNLNTIMGLEAEMEFEIEGDISKAASKPIFNLDKAFETALNNRSELKQALNKVDIAQSDIDSAKSDYGPNAVFFGRYGWRDSELLPQDEDWAIGFGVEFPLFSGFSREHNLRKATSRLAIEDAKTRELVLQLRRQVWESFHSLNQSFQTLQASKELVNEARTSMKLTEDRYKAGKSTITDLLDSQASLAQAEGGNTESQWKYLIAKAAFKRVLGI